MSFLTDPWTWWVHPFVDAPELRTALLASLFAVLCTSVVGTWVVLRGMSFIGDALAHGVLPGIALALVLGWSTTVGAFGAAIAMVLLISLVRSRSPLPEDTSIGIVFVGFLALALVIVSSSESVGEAEVEGFLFGSVLEIEPSNLKWLALASIGTVLAVSLFYRPLIALCFDETKATLLGMRPGLTHALLLLLVALSVVVSFDVVGSLLVFALLVAPPATATLFVRRVPLIMVVAVGLGSLAVLVGLLASHHSGAVPGASIALVAVAMYLFAVASQKSVSNLMTGRNAE